MRSWPSMRVWITCCNTVPWSERVRELVHGAIFTRGVPDLRHTAIFIGGSDVTVGEALLQEVQRSFFGPLRVSVLFDANGANTTAVAAILVRAGTWTWPVPRPPCWPGPARSGSARHGCSRGPALECAWHLDDSTGPSATCEQIQQAVEQADLIPCATATADETAQAIADCDILLAAGAAGHRTGVRRIVARPRAREGGHRLECSSAGRPGTRSSRAMRRSVATARSATVRSAWGD